MEDLKTCTHGPSSPGFIVTQALSPIDTSGNVPGEGQICCRIKLIYQMIECESKATLLEINAKKGAHGHHSSGHDTRMTWQSCLHVCLYMSVCKISGHSMFSLNIILNFCAHRIHSLFWVRSRFLITLQNAVSLLRFWRWSFKSRQPDTQARLHLWIYSISSRRESSSGYRADGDGERWLWDWQSGRRRLLFNAPQGPNIFLNTLEARSKLCIFFTFLTVSQICKKYGFSASKPICAWGMFLNWNTFKRTLTCSRVVYKILH